MTVFTVHYETSLSGYYEKLCLPGFTLNSLRTFHSSFPFFCCPCLPKGDTVSPPPVPRRSLPFDNLGSDQNMTNIRTAN